MDESEHQPPEEQKGPARENVLRLVVEPKPPHAGKRLTRADVLHLIEEHGGPEDLDLRQADLRQADLSQLDLHRATLRRANLRRANLQGADLILTNLQGARLSEANLQEAFLIGADLQGGVLHKANLHGADMGESDLRRAVLTSAVLSDANLKGSNLQEAKLWRASLQGGNLEGSNLEKTDLTGADLQRASLVYARLRDTNLEAANWGDYVLSEEMQGFLHEAASVYRTLKQWHTDAGMYDIAGEFHYREMEARRKLAQKERRFPYALAMYALRFLYGYGERPERVIGWAAAVVFGLALIHWLCGTVSGGFLEALYYSAVSFPALGYGAWAPEPQGWAGRFLGAGESFLGVFMMALFLVTFTRKMTR
jgi:uncharacterized protein YjbI with pentapeptide repeats